MKKIQTIFFAMLLLATTKLYSQCEDSASANLNTLVSSIATNNAYKADNLNPWSQTMPSDSAFSFEINLPQGITSVFGITVNYSATDVQYLKIKNENNQVIGTGARNGSGDFVVEWTTGYSGKYIAEFKINSNGKSSHCVYMVQGRK